MSVSALLRRIWPPFSARRCRERSFDFTTLDFPPLDPDNTFAKLGLAELAQQNGSQEIPASDATAFDGPQSKIIHFVDGEVSALTATANARLIEHNNRIARIDLAPKVQEAQRVASRLESELSGLLQEGMEAVRRSWLEYGYAREEFDRFRRDNALERMPEYPESHLLHWASLVFFVAVESIGNSFFFYLGSPYGIIGGVGLALIFAVVDIVIVFFLGRLIPNVVSIRWIQRTVGFLAATVFIVWALGYNLFVGHFREQYAVQAEAAPTRALETFLQQPLGLTDATSWLLVAFGLVWSVGAMLSGVRWDEIYPGYGRRHRKLEELREEYLGRRSEIAEEAVRKRDEHQAKLNALLKSGEDDVRALEYAIQIKAAMLQNIGTFVRHYEKGANVLLQMYRDHNRRHRKTPAPAYFETPWTYERPESFADDTERDSRKLAEQRKLLGQLSETVHVAGAAVMAAYKTFIDNLNQALEASDQEERVGYLVDTKAR
jgi:hypothetical protein